MSKIFSLHHVLVGFVKLYQYFLSPWIGNSCRFTPTCSNYMIQALYEYGSIKGSYLGIKRICRCNPWCQGGYDPVPPRNKSS